MRMSAIAVVAGVFAAGCAVNIPANRPAVDPDRAAACVTTTERIYFDLESQDLPPASRPILEALVRKVDDCREAGGVIDAVRVVAFPDQSETGPEADRLARERAETVSTALAEMGAPRNKIEIVDYTAINENQDRVLRRHATVGLVMR